MKDIFGPLPIPLVIVMLLFGIAIALLMSVPNAWVFPILRMLGIRIGERKDKDGRGGRPGPPTVSG
ncbi:MAG: hypothetical protein IT161_18640 [Bryobacterales bacterium]|nr:hypothetical protein [Bryobacterales bacterium]